MYYDIDKYAIAAKQRKTDFLITLSVFAVIIVSAISAIIFLRENAMAVAACAIALLWILYKLYDLCKKKPPRVIFSKEIRGEIVNKSTSTREVGRRTVTHAELSIKLEDGRVVSLRKLDSSVFGIYNVGDEIIRLAGTAYPIITSRTPKGAVCPLCGAVITDGSDCKKCRLN